MTKRTLLLSSAPSLSCMACIACAACVACAGNDGDDDDDDDLPPALSETSIVVLVNPVINAGSSTSVQSGSERAGVAITIDDPPLSVTETTNDDGLAIFAPVSTGPNVLDFVGFNGSLTVDVIAPNELYDVVVAAAPGRVEEIVPAIRYAVGGDVVFVPDGGDIAAAAEQDGAIVVLGEGRFPGGVEIRAQGVLLFGAPSIATGDAGDGSVINGDVTWLGGNGRMRGVIVDGALTTNANGFSAAFCELASAQITGNGVTLIKNTFSGDATVPSTNAVLVDNDGLP